MSDTGEIALPRLKLNYDSGIAPVFTGNCVEDERTVVNPSDLRRKIEAEIGSDWSRTNLHSVDLRTALLGEPKIITVLDAAGEKAIQVWLVLEECPGTNAGYGVVYSEQDAAYGLIQFAEGYEPCLFGIYGSFINTFDAM